MRISRLRGREQCDTISGRKRRREKLLNVRIWYCKPITQKIRFISKLLSLEVQVKAKDCRTRTGFVVEGKMRPYCQRFQNHVLLFGLVFLEVMMVLGRVSR